MNKSFYYNEIIKDKLGNKSIYEIEDIKHNQCKDCIKKNKDRCRLNIRDKKCINFMKE